jgi:hypothetical protein
MSLQLLVPLFGSVIDATRRGFEAMNAGAESPGGNVGFRLAALMPQCCPVDLTSKCLIKSRFVRWRAVRDETANSWVIAVEFPRKLKSRSGPSRGILIR